jgi:hypothetical protein
MRKSTIDFWILLNVDGGYLWYFHSNLGSEVLFGRSTCIVRKYSPRQNISVQYKTTWITAICLLAV